MSFNLIWIQHSVAPAQVSSTKQINLDVQRELHIWFLAEQLEAEDLAFLL